MTLKWCYINICYKIGSFLINMVFGSFDYDRTFVFFLMGSIMVTCTKNIVIIVQ